MPAKSDVHPILRKQRFEPLLQIDVAVLGCVVRAKREVEEGKLGATWVSMQVADQPLVLFVAGQEMGVRVDLVHLAVVAAGGVGAGRASRSTHVGVRPGSVENIEPDVAGGERIPIRGVRRRVDPIHG